MLDRHFREPRTTMTASAAVQPPADARIARYQGYLQRQAADIALAGARPASQNGFKVELARRCLVHALRQVTA